MRILTLCSVLLAASVHGEEPLDGRAGRDLLLRLYRPQSTLKVPEQRLARARFPVVDVHTHFLVRLKHNADQLDEFVRVMDRNHIALCCSLDGQLGDVFVEHTKYLSKYRERFVIFANIDWKGAGAPDQPATWDCHRPDFARRIAQQLTDAKPLGVCGLKLFKQFGLTYRNPDGSLVKIDDPRWDPIWEACGRLKLPVIMHTADPVAFFQPIDERNERWEELHRHPDWSFFGPGFPARDELLSARNRVVAKHRQTTFIGAHIAESGEDLQTAATWLDEHPNLYVEIASRIGELGRQPYSARKFLIKYADRVLFGTDGPWPEQRLSSYWRFLETYDENFPYSEKEFPPQGFWNIHGVGLPEEVLRKLYHENAERLIPTVREKLAEWRHRNPTR